MIDAILREQADILAEVQGYWDEHTDYPVADWRYEVINDSTRRGYWEWVATKIEERRIEEPRRDYTE